MYHAYKDYKFGATTEKGKKQDKSKIDRNKPAFGKTMDYKYGRKAYTDMENSLTVMHVDPASQVLEWTESPQNILVICDESDDKVAHAYAELISWLVLEKQLTVFTESKIHDIGKSHLKVKLDPPAIANGKLQAVDHFGADVLDIIDMIVTLGTNATVVKASIMFQSHVPPLISFYISSMDFLSPFPFNLFKDAISKALMGNVPLCIRHRLKSNICRSNALYCQNVKTTEENEQIFLVLNDVVIDRGPNGQLCHLELYVEQELITQLIGDGLIISTPTGSTAYSSAAGSSLVHPSIPSILITPICSHSLSFRPVVMPAGVEVQVVVKEEGNTTVWASFDGYQRMKLSPGDTLGITTSIYPVPCITSRGQLGDWYYSLGNCLHWNVNRYRIPAAVVFSDEELTDKSYEKHQKGSI